MPKPTGDELALLKAVASAPDDDLPRLVYADWLDEHGRAERAEFVRLQIGEHTADSWSSRADCRTAAAALLEEHHLAWTKELPRWVRMWYQERNDRLPDFRRGFIEELSVYFSPFTRFGGDLLARVPISRLTLYQIGRQLPQLARCRWLGRARHLDLCYEKLGERGGAALAANRRLRGVQELVLAGCSLGDDGVRALAAARGLSGLRLLDLSSNHLTPAGVRALRSAPFAEHLQRVELSDNPQLLRHQMAIEDWFGSRAVIAY